MAYNESLDWGVLRYGNVGITGGEYQPGILDEKEVKKIAGGYSNYRKRHRTGNHFLIMGHAKLTVLGWQQADKYDLCQ